MGFLGAVGMIEMMKDRKAALEWHLMYNHYPPVDPVFVDSAEQAIDAIMDYDGDIEIELPNGRVLTAWQIAEQLHLEAFITSDDEDY